MRTNAPTVGFGEVTVIAKNLESIFRESMRLQPSVDICPTKSTILTMARPIVVDMVDAKESPIINPATSAFSAIRFDNRLAKFCSGAAVDGPRRLTVFFTPCLRMGAVSLAVLVVMFQIIRTISLFLSSFSFFRFEFFTHRSMVA